MEKQINFGFCLILSILIHINSQTIENLIIKSANFTINSNSGNKYYYATFDPEVNVPNYLKITVKNDYLFSTINEVISYYKSDSTFKDRQQLSKAVARTAIMWLNKEQIKDGFYFTIETLDTGRNRYSINIIQNDFIELTYGEQYTYYVTEDNKQMKFVIKGQPPSQSATGSEYNNTITIWAKGKKQLSSKLEGANYEKLSKYSAYIIKPEEIKDNSYFLTVEGTVGDLINVGALFFQGNEYNICQKKIKEDLVEITGFLKRGILEENAFDGITKDLFWVKINDHLINKDDIVSKIKVNNLLSYVSIKLPDELDELFYSFHYYISLYNHKDEFPNIIYPLFLGINYMGSFDYKQNLSFIPKWTDGDIEENFKYLTFNIIDHQSQSKAFIATCDTYPICDFNTNDTSKMIPLNKYRGTYSISFNKNEFEINSPISKIQKILFIINDKNSGFSSTLYVNMYTDKDVIMPFQIPVQYKIIRKDNEDNLLIKSFLNLLYEDDKINSYIFIEKLSGNITIHPNYSNYTYYAYQNIQVFKLESNKEILPLKIIAQKDSIYSIKYYEYSEYINCHYFFIGGNYVFNIQNHEPTILFFGMKTPDDFVNIEEKVNYYFLSIDCTVDIIIKQNIIKSYQLPKLKEIIYQDITTSVSSTYEMRVKTEKEKNSCMLYVSSYYMNGSLIVDEKSFILEENIPKIVIFNNAFNITKYSYYSIVNNEDIKINFALLSKGKYEIIFFINQLEIENKYNIEKSTLITLEPKVWKDICYIANQPCEISFNILTKNTDIDSFLKITVNPTSDENEDYSGDGSEDNNTNENGTENGGGSSTVLIVVITTVSVILIVGAVFIFLKFRKKGEIKEEIEKIPQNKESQLY